MRRLVLTCAAVATFAFPSSALADASIRECGNYGDKGNGRTGWTYGEVYGAGIFNVTSRVVGCRTARRVSRRAFNTYGGGRRWRYRGWSCRIVSQRHEYTDARCTRGGGRVVRWQTGA